METSLDFVLASGLVGDCPQPAGAPQPPFDEGSQVNGTS
jgi:hypothetical protein